MHVNRCQFLIEDIKRESEFAKSVNKDFITEHISTGTILRADNYTRFVSGYTEDKPEKTDCKITILMFRIRQSMK